MKKTKPWKTKLKKKISNNLQNKVLQIKVTRHLIRKNRDSNKADKFCKKKQMIA